MYSITKAAHKLSYSYFMFVLIPEVNCFYDRPAGTEK